jgi:SGNH domain (fused to AT3 domains)
VTAVTCVLLVTIDGARDDLVSQSLALAPVVYLGRVSYGTYLWHWPIIVIALRIVDISPGALFGITALLATGLASLSFQILERPVRESRRLDRYRLPVVAVGLTLGVIGAFILAPAIGEDQPSHGVATRGVDAISTGTDPFARDFDWRAARDDWKPGSRCINGPVTNCTMVSGGRPRILLIGDSNADMLVPAFIEIARRRGATLSVATRESCPWQRDLLFADLRHEDVCRRSHIDFYDRLIPDLDPDVVIAINRTFDDPNSTAALDTPRGRVDPGTPAFLPAVRRATERSLKSFRDRGRRVVMIEPIPYASADDNPTLCLSRAKLLAECRYVASPGPTGVERVYRDVAAHTTGTWDLDMDRLVCPYLPICDPVVGGEIVKMDRGHITATYSRAISPDIEKYLVENAVIEPSKSGR